MNHEEFEKRLRELGAKVTMATVRNWANDGLIPTYTPMTKRERKKRRARERLSELHAPTARELGELIAKTAPEDDPVARFGFFDEPYKILPISCYLGDSDETESTRKKRPGRYTDWPKDALVEAAAIWAMKNHNRDCKGNKVTPKAVSPEIIGNVQLIAREAYKHPRPFFRITGRIIDGLWPDDPFMYKDVEMMLVSDEKLNQLTRAYIAAVGKARSGTPVKEPRRVILKEDICERDDVLLEESASKAILDSRLAKSAEKKGRKLTPGEVRRAKRLHEKLKVTSPVVCSSIDIDLKPTDAECDEIELWVRQPGGKKWVDSRKLAMRCTRG